MAGGAEGSDGGNGLDLGGDEGVDWRDFFARRLSSFSSGGKSSLATLLFLAEVLGECSTICSKLLLPDDILLTSKFAVLSVDFSGNTDELDRSFNQTENLTYLESRFCMFSLWLRGGR